MKILIIMGGFFPGEKYGGPPVSVDNFCTLMSDNECYIVTRNHDLGEKKPYENIEKGWNKRDNCKVLYLQENEYNSRSFRKIINEINPDILYLQGLFQKCVFPCIKLARKYNIKVFLAPRGELCAGALKKKYKKIPYIFILKFTGMLNDIHFQSTSDEETKAIQKWLKIEKGRIHYLTNIPFIPKNNYLHYKKEKGSIKLIFLSRIHPKKNLLFALQCLKKINGNIQFDIYGPIEDREYWEKCKYVITTMPQSVKVKYCGVVSHENVHETFAKYDAFFFPTLSENFGHVIVESLISECPVIISDQTPWNDITEEEIGWAIPLDKRTEYIKIIQCLVDKTDDEINQIRRRLRHYVEENLKIDEIKQNYENTLEQIMESK